MVCKLRNLKEVACQPAHQSTRPVLIVEFKVKALQFIEQIRPYISLNSNTEGMPPVCHNVVTPRPKHICKGDYCHHNKECPILALWKQLIHRCPGNKRKRKVDKCNHYGASHVEYKYPSMWFEISK